MASKRRSAGTAAHAREWLLLAAVTLPLLGCGGGEDGPPTPVEPEPVPGVLKVRLSTSGPAGAAFKLTVTGASITDPGPAQSIGYQVFVNQTGNQLVAVVAGQLGGGDVLEFSVPDVNRVGEYQATLDEVAAPDGQLQAVGAYSVVVTR